MEVIREPTAMRSWADQQIAQGRRIGLVPTMGYLHAGHLSLVAAAKARADRVVASIFVNPTQFGPSEDFSRYPRDFEGDSAKLAAAGVDVVFAPTKEMVYPKGFDCFIVPESMATVLCGASRPGHFRGVCTVVHLLFRMTRAHTAIFGEKDFQQLQIIRRMVRDLWLDVDVVGMPIIREPDGLAMSSRNVYLAPNERQDALVLRAALDEVARAYRGGERRVDILEGAGKRRLALASAVRLDYLAVVDAETLSPITTIKRPAVCAVAAYVGKTRLIDNQQL